MKLHLSLEMIGEGDRGEVGGKAFALAGMVRAGLAVPPALVVTAAAYRRYVRATGLGERLLLELNRKRFEEMRWEEMWDASLRIRNMFLTTALPDDLGQGLGRALEGEWADTPVVVRSSALDEDAAGASFAGLHESYVNVRGVEDIIRHVRLVWASLWSDAALLYRRELGLDVAQSAMAVLVQRLVSGERSGVAFCVDPTDNSRALVEAAHGLNQGLVDGTVEPDRWTLDRQSGALLEHRPVERREAVRPSDAGVALVPLSRELAAQPPLLDREVTRVFGMARRCEEVFGRPQDVEWTYASDRLYVLQSRPITTGEGEEGQRSWYLSLRRSYDNLQKLRTRIESTLIPAMISEAERLARVDLDALSDEDLAAEMDRRLAAREKWTGVYWDEFIPFAHGARLFGQVYNDAMQPEDPFEFITLLAGSSLASIRRHVLMSELVRRLREEPQLAEALEAPGEDLPDDFRDRLDDLVRQLGALGLEGSEGATRSAALRLLLEAAQAPPTQGARGHMTADAIEQDFLARFPQERRGQAAELLDLARASYRLRDDDNIYLGQVEAELNRAAAEGRRRLAARGLAGAERMDAGHIAPALRDPAFRPPPPEEEAAHPSQRLDARARQLTGQPAGPGLATGAARVILQPADLFDFKAGEVLVCDAIDPNMTLVVPLCAAIVERRGGMLIHGAIIAREYGLPCVTGVPQATELIRTGDTLTVDGHLGIVVLTGHRR